MSVCLVNSLCGVSSSRSYNRLWFNSSQHCRLVGSSSSPFLLGSPCLLGTRALSSDSIPSRRAQVKKIVKAKLQPLQVIDAKVVGTVKGKVKKADVGKYAGQKPGHYRDPKPLSTEQLRIKYVNYRTNYRLTHRVFLPKHKKGTHNPRYWKKVSRAQGPSFRLKYKKVWRAEWHLNHRKKVSSDWGYRPDDYAIISNARFVPAPKRRVRRWGLLFPPYMDENEFPFNKSSLKSTLNRRLLRRKAKLIRKLRKVSPANRGRVRSAVQLSLDEWKVKRMAKGFLVKKIRKGYKPRTRRHVINRSYLRWQHCMKLTSPRKVWKEGLKNLAYATHGSRVAKYLVSERPTVREASYRSAALLASFSFPLSRTSKLNDIAYYFGQDQSFIISDLQSTRNAKFQSPRYDQLGKHTASLTKTSLFKRFGVHPGWSVQRGDRIARALKAYNTAIKLNKPRSVGRSVMVNGVVSSRPAGSLPLPAVVTQFVRSKRLKVIQTSSKLPITVVDEEYGIRSALRVPALLSAAGRDVSETGDERIDEATAYNASWIDNDRSGLDSNLTTKLYRFHPIKTSSKRATSSVLDKRGYDGYKDAYEPMRAWPSGTLPEMHAAVDQSRTRDILATHVESIDEVYIDDTYLINQAILDAGKRNLGNVAENGPTAAASLKLATQLHHARLTERKDARLFRDRFRTDYERGTVFRKRTLRRLAMGYKPSHDRRRLGRPELFDDEVRDDGHEYLNVADTMKDDSTCYIRLRINQPGTIKVELRTMSHQIIGTLMLKSASNVSAMWDAQDHWRDYWMSGQNGTQTVKRTKIKAHGYRRKMEFVVRLIADHCNHLGYQKVHLYGYDTTNRYASKFTRMFVRQRKVRVISANIYSRRSHNGTRIPRQAAKRGGHFATLEGAFRQSRGWITPCREESVDDYEDDHHVLWSWEDWYPDEDLRTGSQFTRGKEVRFLRKFIQTDFHRSGGDPGGMDGSDYGDSEGTDFYG